MSAKSNKSQGKATERQNKGKPTTVFVQGYGKIRSRLSANPSKDVYAPFSSPLFRENGTKLSNSDKKIPLYFRDKIAKSQPTMFQRV